MTSRCSSWRVGYGVVSNDLPPWMEIPEASNGAPMVCEEMLEAADIDWSMHMTQDVDAPDAAKPHI